MPLKFLVADSSHYGGDFFEKFLRENFNCELVKIVSNCRDMVQNLNHNTFDLVFVDIDLEDASPMEVCRQLRQLQTPVPVIGLSMGDEYYQCRLLLDACARGFLMKNSSQQELRRGIEAVCAGTMYVCARCQHLLSSRVQRLNELDDFHLEVLVRMIDEKEAIYIANELFVSLGKVKRARQKIMALAKTRKPYGILRWASYYGFVSSRLTV